MRLISLQEQQPSTPIQLSKAELGYLANCKHLSVSVADANSQLYLLLRPGSTIGTLVWSDLAVLIRPKVHIANVFFLLGFRPRLVDWGDQSFQYPERLDLLTTMARFLDREVRHGLSYGLARGYVERSESITTVRGRIALARQIRSRQGVALPLECDFAEYTEDITLNRALKAALRRVRLVAHLDRPVALSLIRAEAAFTDVLDVDYAAADVPEVAFTRLNQRWESAFRLAQMILRCESLRDDAGRVAGASFTVDMNVAFEKFIEELVNQEARRAGLESSPQAPVKLTAEIVMQPDLQLRRHGDTVAVGDTKYIDVEPNGWRHANVYQMLAYCTALRLQRGLLIYATPHEPASYHVTAAGIDIEVVGLNLSNEPRELESEARRIVRRLVQHAALVPVAAAVA